MKFWVSSVGPESLLEILGMTLFIAICGSVGGFAVYGIYMFIAGCAK
jgi:hypothetical protein